MKAQTQPRADIYSRVTSKIIADLEQGVRPWQRPWNADHAAGNIIRPLRATGQPEPCPTRYEPERRLYFHPEMSLKRRI